MPDIEACDAGLKAARTGPTPWAGSTAWRAAPGWGAASSCAAARDREEAPGAAARAAHSRVPSTPRSGC